MPPILYHGAALSNLDSILKHGIRPRFRRRPANDPSFSSSPNCVYLSDAYAVKFAVDAMKPKDTGIVVFEIDTSSLPQLCFGADDDFIAQYLAERHDISHKKAVALAQTSLLDYDPEISLQYSGSCSFEGTVPPSAIIRYATVDFETQKWWLIGASDVGTGAFAYRFTKNRHCARLQSLFDNIADTSVDHLPEEMRSAFSVSLPNRDGVEVVQIRKD